VSRDARASSSQEVRAPGWRGVLRGAAPLALLGCARLASTRGTGYEVPLDEYGRDWNFFFTLAAVRLLAAAPLPPRALLRGRAAHRGAPAAALAAAAVLLAHEAILRLGGTARALASPARGRDLFSQNREGVCSVVRSPPSPSPSAYGSLLLPAP
jgi:hypothetical protein